MILSLFLFGVVSFSSSAAPQDIPATDQRITETRHTDLKYTMPVYQTRQEWEARAAQLKAQILASAGLTPMPARTPLNAEVFGRVDRGDYTTEKVLFESLPGFYVTGNLYRPKTSTGPARGGRIPAVLCPHGHWAYGRLENTTNSSIPARAANFARMGMIAFTYDMVGYDDSVAISHKFAPGHREGFDAAELWSINLLGLQLWNSIRALDFLLSLPEVDATRIGSTGASGGATQTFLHAAIDDRVKVTAPVNMISSIMQGGSLCENAPGLRIDTHNMELGALTAPRPMLMVSATGDWTRNTMNVEYPAVRSVYRLFGAEDDLHAVQINAPHNYNQESREAVYGWFAHYLLGQSAKTPLKEKSTSVGSLAELLVFHGRQRPAKELDETALLNFLQARAKTQLEEAWPRSAAGLEAFRKSFGSDLRYALMAEYPRSDDIVSSPNPELINSAGGPASVILTRRSHGDRVVGKFWPAAKVTPPQAAVLLVLSPGEDADGAEVRSLVEKARAKGRHVLALQSFSSSARPPNQFKYFATYNRSDDANRVQDILTSIAYLRKQYPGLRLEVIGRQRAGLLVLLARAFAPRVDRVAVDVAGFDSSSDEAFVGGLPIPGIRRAGDFGTTTVLAPFGPLLIYNTNGRFNTDRIATGFQNFGKSSDLRVVSGGLSTEQMLDWLMQ